jgi:predicted permease
MLTGILFGLSPALRATRVDLTPALKESAGALPVGAPGRRGLRLGPGRALVVAQVSLSLPLLVGAGLFVRTLSNLENVKAGFNERNLLLFGIDPTQDGYTGQRLTDFYQELMLRLEALPGVRSVSLSHSTLIGGGRNFQRIHLQGYTPKSGEEVGAAINWVGPKFFETLGIPLVLGRTIAEGDTEGAPKVVVVNGQFVRRFLGAGNPIGRRFGLGEGSSEDTEIVGVVADAKYSDLRQEAPATIYVPWLQNLGLGAIHFEVRTAGNPMALASAVRRVAQDMDRNLALYDVRSQEEQINQTLFQERLFARLTSFFGALAALLACVGLYGIMAFTATRRTREMGIRMALGASRSQILQLALRETFLLVTIGIAAGILAALGAARLISTLLYGLKPTDPLTMAAAALLMVAVAALAGYIPARRASRVDPMVALRYE